MRFQVPQFTEAETKLVGPLNLRQFLWFLGAGVIFLIVQFFTKGTILLIIGIILAVIAASMAWVRIGNLSLPAYFLNAIVFAVNPKKFTYQKTDEQK